MLRYERQQNILDILNERHSISVKELAKLVYASEASVRRDIEKLEASGFVEKIYGGVVLSGCKNEVVPVELRETVNSHNKEKIAIEAAKLVSDGETIFLDSSSTARRICKHLLGKKNIKIITNNVRVCNENDNQDISVYITGGLFSKKRDCFIGGFSEEFVKNVYADIMFFSSNGVSVTGEITDISEDEINLRKLMIKHSRKTYYLCDSSKIGGGGPFRICNVKDIDGIICDKELEFKE